MEVSIATKMKMVIILIIFIRSVSLYINANSVNGNPIIKLPDLSNDLLYQNGGTVI